MGGQTASRIATLAAYVALPTIGIVFWGWDWRSVIILYWLENVTVGVITVIRMARTTVVQAPGASALTFNGSARPAARGGLIMFFCAHYGLFTLVHGVFVAIIVSGVFRGFGASGAIGAAGSGAAPAEIDIAGILLIWGVSSAVQIVTSFFTPQKNELPPVSKLFTAPYGRIFVLHLTILGGAWLISALGWPPAAALLLVALHFVLDLREMLGARRSMR